MKKNFNTEYFNNLAHTSFLMSICIVGITSIILNSSSTRVFAEQTIYSCYGVTNDYTQSVCATPNPDTLPTICVLENTPISLTNYYSGDYDLLPQSEKYSEIVTIGNPTLLPTSFPSGTPIPNYYAWSYDYNTTSPTVSLLENYKLLNLKFETDTLVSETQQGEVVAHQ